MAPINDGKKLKNHQGERTSYRFQSNNWEVQQVTKDLSLGGEPKAGKNRIAILGLILAVVLGSALRLVWVSDMEYKREEAWTFERTQKVSKTEPFPWLGMPNSVEVPHPGMSLWVFLGLGKLFAVMEPTDLGRACQIANVSAILLLLAFVLRAVPVGQREPWLWAVALASLNPLAVLLQRKIWPPSILPLFSVGLLICWWHRKGRRGAFAWGLAGAILCQVHPAGLFVASGFAAWALLFDRKGTSWLCWSLGSILGSLTLIPWILQVWTRTQDHAMKGPLWINVFEMKFWLRWVTEPFGISLQYSLGGDFGDFLRYPLVFGQATYLVGVLHAIMLAASAALLGWAGYRLWQQRGRWLSIWVGKDSSSAFTQSACLWGFGILFTASCLPIHRHYMVITFPLMFLWVARLALIHDKPSAGVFRFGRCLLLVLCVSQGLVTASFLGYIHVNQRQIQGDYGLPYRAQVQAHRIAQG